MYFDIKITEAHTCRCSQNYCSATRNLKIFRNFDIASVFFKHLEMCITREIYFILAYGCVTEIRTKTCYDFILPVSHPAKYSDGLRFFSFLTATANLEFVFRNRNKCSPEEGIDNPQLPNPSYNIIRRCRRERGNRIFARIERSHHGQMAVMLRSDIRKPAATLLRCTPQKVP